MSYLHGRIPALAAGFLALAASSSAARAQDVHWAIHGDPGWHLSGVRPVGDVNQDGISDLVVGAKGARVGNVHGGGLTVVSGVDGQPLLPWIFGPDDYGFGRYVTGVGDFDGDGTPDFASGVVDDGPGTFDGEVYIWSGADASLLAFIPAPFGIDRFFGWGVFGLGDLDGDGRTEVAGIFNGDPEVYIYSGPAGQLFRIHPGFVPPWEGGGDPWLDTIGDVDGDSVPDYVVGWHRSGIVTLFSGASGSPLFRVKPNPHQPYPSNSNFGQGVTGMGDVDGDCIPDFAVSATFDNDCTSYNTPEPAFVSIHSGLDGSIIRHISDTRVFVWGLGCSFYRIDSGGHDVNGDGIGDLITGSPWADYHWDPSLGYGVGGLMAVYSGATGTMLWQIPAYTDGTHGALVGDLTGDGLSEFAVGIYRDSSVNPTGGSVTVYEGAPGDAKRYCAAAENSTGRAASMHLEGPISVGNNRLHLFVEHAPAAQVGLFVYGPGSTPTPFGDGVLCAGGPGTLRRLTGPITLDAEGSALVPIDMSQGPMAQPGSAWTPGSTWTLQFLYRDPAGPGGTGGTGTNASDAMRVTFVL